MMDSHVSQITKGKIRSLPLDLWPEADRNAWISACRPAARLKRGGAAGHLKPITRDDLARRYGYFLDFLSRRGLLQVGTLAATCVTLENVETYIAELKQRVGSVTLYGSIHKLRHAAEIIAPSLEFAWLGELEKHLALDMRPRSKFDRIVLIEVLVEAALTLIHEAETSPNLVKPCPGTSGSQWVDGGVARHVPHPPEELRRLGNWARLCRNQKQVVDRACGLGDERKPPRRAAHRRAAQACNRPLPQPTQTGTGADR